MSSTWTDKPMPETAPITAGGWLRIARRGIPMGLIIFGGAVVLNIVRLIERPIHGTHRPWTPWITQTAVRAALWLMGLRIAVEGRPMQGPGALVANHVSWLDIFTLNATDRVYFVSKAEVSGWPGIGWLARSVGTVFIERNRRHASAQTQMLFERLEAGHRLLFFPEGTSTDNLRVLPFKSTLFAAFLNPPLQDMLHVQPVSVIYHAPQDAPEDFYGWWGDMPFGPNLLKILAAPRHGNVSIIFHTQLKVSDFANRKDLAAACEAQVRAGLSAR